MNVGTIHDGSHRRSWTIGVHLARKRIFFRLRWSRSRSVADNLLGVDICLIVYHFLTKAFTGAIPFSAKPPRAAMLAIIDGERPPRPTHPVLTDELWALTQRCWDQEPHLRPSALRISYGLYVSTLEPRVHVGLIGFSHSRGIPAWKRLIDLPLATDERISLITDIISDRGEAEAIKHLQGDDAQSFVDVIDEVPPHSFISKE